MRAGDVVPLVWGSLRMHRVRTRMTYAAIAIGVGSVLLLTAMGEGARSWVTGQFETLGAQALIVLPGRTETRGGIPLLPASTRDITLEDAHAIRSRLPGVRRVVPLAIGEAPVSHDGRSRASILVGATSDYLGLLGASVGRGTNLPAQDFDADPRICVLGATVAREVLGDHPPLGARIRIGESAYRVVGVLEPKGQSLMVNLDEIVLIPVAGALKMLNRAGLFRIIVQIHTAADIEPARARLTALLKDRHDGEEDFTLLTPGAVADAFGEIIRILTGALAGIAAVSLAVAGIGVMNVMVVTVVERSAEIGLMKALGAGRGQILMLFLAEAATLAAVGGAIGAGGGWVLVEAARALLPDLPFRIPLWALGASLGVAAVTGVVFGLIPAARAARLEPLDALRRKA